MKSFRLRKTKNFTELDLLVKRFAISSHYFSDEPERERTVLRTAVLSIATLLIALRFGQHGPISDSWTRRNGSGGDRGLWQNVRMKGEGLWRLDWTV
jgi:hypothetical protein